MYNQLNISYFYHLYQTSKSNDPEDIAFEMLFSHLGLTVFENTENSIELIKVCDFIHLHMLYSISI